MMKIQGMNQAQRGRCGEVLLASLWMGEYRREWWLKHQTYGQTLEKISLVHFVIMFIENNECKYRQFQDFQAKQRPSLVVVNISAGHLDDQ